MKIEIVTKSSQKKIDNTKEIARNREEKIAKSLSEALRNKRAKE
jgi:hypothetical protein